VFLELFELEAVRVVLIDHFEGQSCLFICDLLAHLLHHGPELDEVETALALLAEIAEHLLQRQLVPLYHLVQFYKHLCHALPRRTRGPHLLQGLLEAVYFEHLDDLLDRDGAAAVDVGGPEDVDCLFLGDFGVDCAEEVEVAVEGEVFLLVLEAVLVEELLETVLVEVEVLPQLCHDALHRLLVLLALRQPQEEALEDGVREHFPPAESLALAHLQRPFEEVRGLGREVSAAEGQRLAFDVFDEFVLAVAGPGRTVVQHFVEDEAEGPDVALVGVGLGHEYFWRHVERSAHVAHHLHHFLAAARQLLGEAEVGQLVLAAGDEDVRGLEVAACGQNYRCVMFWRTSS